MTSENSDSEEVLISRGLYRLISDVIGSRVLVLFRRERFKVIDLLAESKQNNCVEVMSGSMAEGFHLKSSDYDFMRWSTDIVVVESYSQLRHIMLQPYQSSVLMMDCDHTSPGFALVKCITRDDTDASIATTCVQHCDEFWVSSKLYREYYLNSSPLLSVHGPCQSGQMLGTDFDFAQCLKCTFWPKQAEFVISRMRRCGWPPEDVIRNMINDGCLLVPVASRKPLFEEAPDMEWRISFSLAEKRLIYSMNHCQFLCYGLWKLFMTEAIKKLSGMEDLLCSYFLKTIVFWEICRDPTSWEPENFISKFLQTLKMLIDCVNTGNCPNFFIPDNNMFYGKVCGEKRETLLGYLREFHNEGFHCLLRCQSLQNKFLTVISNPQLARNKSVDEGEYISNDLRRMMYLHFIVMCKPSVGDVNKSLHELGTVLRVKMSSDFMSTALAIRKHYLLQNIAERILHGTMERNMPLKGNKAGYGYRKCALDILRNNNSYLGYSELIAAKTFYLFGDYRRAVRAANVVKSKLQSSSMTYGWVLNKDLCRKLQNPELTIQQFIKQHVAMQFDLDEDTALYELYPEIRARGGCTGSSVLHIPPLVMAYFLLFLSYHKLGDMIHMYDVLRELHVLVYHDANFHIRLSYGAISWEILGICQQLCREYPAAHYSYIRALNDKHNDFKPATVERLNSLQ